ncbi:flavin-containing monooxygenase [Streptomyces sp. NPDC087440]|uniref:flavin-containing monooxygenase n=1 Tax=Streptomyces sp. NPDC087440 TaxID=3365790 RepID=UPI0037FE4B3E
MKKNICVIGAGPSGLVTVKELRDEGHDVTCYEHAAEIGGVFRAELGEDEAGAYDSTMLTISNYMMTFSSFPPPRGQERRFWSAAEYRQYLHDFADAFGLAAFVVCRTDVLSVARAEGGGCTVEVAPVDDPAARTAHHFDAVVISTGTHRVPHRIEIPGESEFTGEIVHSAHYRNNRPFRGKRVLCVGIGETAADVVNEIAQTAQSCVLSVRRHQSVVERYPGGGEHTNDAFTSHLLHSVPLAAAGAFMRAGMIRTSKHGRTATARAVGAWNARNKHFFHHFLTKNESFLHRVVDGSLTVNASGIERLGEDYVQFKDGRREKIDTIMLNTGYVEDFGLLKDQDIADVRGLYKHMIHPRLGTEVVLVGWARPAAGGVPACSEMQARYFALLCSGKLHLPDGAKLQALIERQASYENEVFHGNPRLRTLVHYNHYMIDFSRVIGCSPWRPALLRSPRLAYKLWCGSQMPHIYRLFGPHRDPATARRTVLGVPNAFSLPQALAIAAVSTVSRGLIALGLMKADPRY